MIDTTILYGVADIFNMSLEVGSGGRVKGSGSEEISIHESLKLSFDFSIEDSVWWPDTKCLAVLLKCSGDMYIVLAGDRGTPDYSPQYSIFIIDKSKLRAIKGLPTEKHNYTLQKIEDIYGPIAAFTAYTCSIPAKKMVWEPAYT